MHSIGEQHEAVSVQIRRGQGGPEGPLGPLLPMGSCPGRLWMHARQIVYGGGKRESPADPRDAAMAHLAPKPQRVQPAQELFDAFAFPLAHGVARMLGGAPLTGARLTRGMVLDRRGAPQLTQGVVLRNEVNSGLKRWYPMRDPSRDQNQSLQQPARVTCPQRLAAPRHRL